MLEARGNLWDFHNEGAIVCITTNNVIKKTNELVMGAGIAGYAKTMFPGIARDWGTTVLAQKTANHGIDTGAHVHLDAERRLIMFPTKYEWSQPSDLALIERSCRQLTELVRIMNYDGKSPMVYLPRPGCGLGQLQWDDVRPIIAPLLSDLITVITF